MKVWISKYALTQGIYDVEVSDPDAHQIVEQRHPNMYSTFYHGEGREWHRTEAGARTRANEMVQKKIKSLERSLAKFKKLRF
jgi:hypothetical protein